MSLALSMNPEAIQRRAYRAKAREAAGLPPAGNRGGPRMMGGSVSRAVIAGRMVDVDRAYRAANAAPVARRCCSKCKTPYSICANKACACHSF